MEHSEGFLKLVNDARKRIHEISVETTLERMNAGEGARLIGRGVIERDIERLVPEKGTELILYCGGGYRSALAAEVLQRMGYYDVSSMTGGWKAWKEAGAPVESD
jgi:rhodanese-related sulfurtransferase